METVVSVCVDGLVVYSVSPFMFSRSCTGSHFVMRLREWLIFRRYFTWDSGKFPTPADMQKSLAKKGRKVGPACMLQPMPPCSVRCTPYEYDDVHVSDGGHH